MNQHSLGPQQPRWLNSLLQQRGQFILAIPVTCLVTSLAAFGWLQYKTANAEYWVRHTQQVRLDSKILLSALLDGESAVRGYELTRQQEFLKPYQAAIASVPNSIDKLKDLVKDNPSQEQRLQQIEKLVQERIISLERGIQLAEERTLNINSPELISQVIEGTRTMDKTREQIDRFVAEEERLQVERDQRLRQQQQLTWLVLGLSAGVGIFGSILAAYLLDRLEGTLRDRESNLRESEARYRLLIENFPDGAVLLFDPELRYIFADGTALATAGQSKQQIEGKTIWEVWSPEDSAILEPIYRKALAGEPSKTEFSYADHSYLIQALPLRNERGEIFAGMVVRQDISEHKQAEEQQRASEERYRQLVELCPDGIFIQTGGKFSLVNRAAMQLFGAASAEDLVGKPILDLVHPDDEEIVRERMRKLLEDREAVPLIEETWFRLDGTILYAEVAAIPFNYQGQPAAQVVIHDITERKLAEKQLYQLNRALRTLSECNQALVRATDEPTLLHNICRIIVEFGGYHSAWIGIAEHDEAKTVRPAAQVGFAEGYLESQEISWSEEKNGSSPVGTAIRTSSPQIFQNVTTDLQYLRFREAALKRGYASSITLPLIFDAQPLGALSIYAADPNAFDEAEEKLLTELANDLAYGITALRTQAERRAAQASLRDNEAKFRAFLESASEAIIVSNCAGEIIIFNAKAEELFGYDRSEVLGRTVEFLIPERYRHRHVDHRDNYLEHPTNRSMSRTMDLFARRKDGSEFPIEAGLSSVQTNDGKFVMTFLTDITERKQAEEEIRRLNESLERRARESETRYQQIVELAEEGVWVIDDRVKTNYVNHAMARMLGYTESEMLGCSIYDFMYEAERQAVHSLIERRKQGAAEKYEFKLKAKDGRLVWTYMSTSPILDESGNLLGSCALVYDITERKKAEEQLRQSSERISLANAELARATRLKDEFLASMSHELRTPLNAILGLSEALKEEVYGTLTQKQHQSLTTIEQSGRHLLELINDILDLSKIESGKMEFQLAPTSLQSLCEASLAFVKQLAHSKHIKLNSKIPKDFGDIEVDERRIRQVLINLLSNAVKFTPEGGEVGLEVEADAESETLRMSVIDTGIGIAPENIDKLFQPFVQLDSSLSRRYSGTGLGLALVRRIVELHGGSVSLESELGKGSKFTVILPWKESEQMRQSAAVEQQGHSGLLNIRHVLIVEDSDPAAKQSARYLAEMGITASIHPCGGGVVDAAVQNKPDAIILDILLPDMSGWEVLVRLKSNLATQHIPVLVVSVVDERSQAMAMGASDYLLKPFSRQQLQLTLSKIFKGSSQSSGESNAIAMPQSDRHSPLILLAEDNEANISTLVDYLQVQNYRVVLARNGLEAVEIAKQQKPDLILMDIQMPEMDGLEATRLIRGEADLATIPIIALTALAMPGDRERCLGAGATDYMTKPVGLKKLKSTITQHLNL